MWGKNINFNNKKINKSNFYKKKKLSKINYIDVNKILVPKKNHMVLKVHLNIPLDIVIMMTLNHYV